MGYGRRHVIGQVTHARIQELIRQSGGISRAIELGWKAGYIEGFVQEMLELRPRDKEDLYDQANAMYNSLSRIVG